MLALLYRRVWSVKAVLMMSNQTTILNYSAHGKDNDHHNAESEILNHVIHRLGQQTQESIALIPIVGGLTNLNYRLRLNDRDYFVKIFAAGTAQFIDRQLAYEAAQQAHQLGIAPQVIDLDLAQGVEVVEFLTDYRPSRSADFSRLDFLQAAIGLYQRLHHAPMLSRTKTVFDMTEEHIQQGDQLGALRPHNFASLMHKYHQAKRAFLASGLDLAPCHNDPMPGNFMVNLDAEGQIQQMQLIDFEYASNNERAYEIGVFLGELFVDELTSMQLIEQYYGQLRNDLLARVNVARAVADMKWASWAMQQRQLSDWDFDYHKYGIWKYARANSLFQDPRWEDWLRAI